MSVWKGRFAGGLHPEALAFSTSLPVDRKLFEEDLDGSLAHAAMLARQGIVSASDAKKIRKALEEIRREIRQGRFPALKHDGKTGEKARGGGGHGKRKRRNEARFTAEDIHMAIEARLIQKVGAAGARLHTARSRNDQIALDERLYLRTAIARLLEALHQVQRSLLGQAERYQDVLMPGYTHLQRAQPILLAHHLLAYVEMLDRDRGRLVDCLRRASRSPLGASALAGTSFPIDRDFVAAQLGLSGIVSNSIDAVSDRDAVIECTAACATIMMHLSRLGEELVLWSSREWSFVEIGDAFATGSSIMPQKKNPDMAELVRGKTGRVYGDLIALLTVMKGLPLAYNRDMQEDKEPLFDAVDTTRASLRIMALMVQSLMFRADRFERELREDFSTATDLADDLVRKGMPFRHAHAVVGAVVRQCAEQGRGLQELTPRELRKFSGLLGADTGRFADPRGSVERKISVGSTSPREVARALQRWKRRLSEGVVL